jgi:hypothetical protein
MGVLTIQRGAERRRSGRAPGRADREAPPLSDPPVAPAGVELPRLLALARLTAPQALEIAAGVFAAADVGNPDGTPAGIAPVVITADGRVVLGHGADGARNGKPSGPAMAGVLAQLADAVRLRGRDADPAAARLVAALDRAVAELPAGDLPVVAPVLAEAADTIDRPAARAELAALVEALTGAVGVAGGPGPAAIPSTPVRTAPARGAAGRGSRTARRRIGAWLLSAVVLASIVVVEVVVLRDEIATDIGLLLDAGRSGPTPSSAPEPDGLPVPPPAPTAAGSVAAVDVRPLGHCAPDAPCTVRLLVRLVPAPERQIVTWSYRLVDRCTGATGTAAGGSVAVPAKDRRATAVGTVRLPAARAVAVVAVTEKPAVAASAPLFVGSCRPDRPAG